MEKWTRKLERKRTSPCNCAGYKRACASRLLPVQAWALEEINTCEGLLGPIEVGGGKTLLDLLAAMVMPRCKVAVLLIPPNLRSQLEMDWEFYEQHWDLPNLAGGRWSQPGRPVLHVLAYSELSSASNTARLTQIRPDTIIADEAQSVRNPGASRGRRFNRYFSEHPDTRLCAWSGTLTSKSMHDYAHLAKYSLRDGSPVPLQYTALEAWAGALDPVKLGTMPTPPGDLMKLAQPGESAQEAYSTRLLETYGVVSSPAVSSCSASLVFRERPLKVPAPIQAAYDKLQASWDRPDGEPLMTAIDVARCGREIASGLFNRWRWPRNEPLPVRQKWLEVRKRWHAEVRERLKYAREFLDSPLLATQAAVRWHDGYEKDGVTYPPQTKKGPMVTWASLEWPEWAVTCDTAQPETEAVWIDDFMLQDAILWGREAPGIIWYEHAAFGAKLAEMGGFAFYGPGEEADREIRNERGERTIVATILSHGTGKNLQAFNRNLICQPPSDGARWEQLLGRTHRTGQLASEVGVWVYRHLPVMKEALDKARSLAGHIQGTFGGSQRLLKAQYLDLK